MLKYFNRRGKRGQSTLEYVILIIIVAGALLAIQVYVKRGIQGRMKQASDDIGEQYSVGNTNINKTTKTHSKTADTFSAGVSRQQLVENETTNVIGNSAIMNVQNEYWGN